MTRIAHIFKREPADQVRKDMLYEADRLHVEHQAAAELHAGLSAVYRMRSERLRRELDGSPSRELRSIK